MPRSVARESDLALKLPCGHTPYPRMRQLVFISNAGEGIRTLELLRERTLNPSPLTRLGNPRVHICRHQKHYTCSPLTGHPAPEPDPGAASAVGIAGFLPEKSPDRMKKNISYIKDIVLHTKVTPGYHTGGAPWPHSGRIAPGNGNNKTFIELPDRILQ